MQEIHSLDNSVVADIFHSNNLSIQKLIYPEHFQLAASDTIILFQMFVLTFGNLVLAASNLN